MKITHEFKLITEQRKDITIELKESSIFSQPSSSIVDTGDIKAIGIIENFGMGGDDLFIVIPIDKINEFCLELQRFTENIKLRKIVSSQQEIELV